MGIILKTKAKIALYPGTFDPITNGHFDVIERALGLFDELIIAVAVSLDKQPMFSLEERINMIEKSTAHLQNITVIGFDNLTVDLAKEKNATILIRGLRAVSDFEYELQLGYLNKSLDNTIETVYLMPRLNHAFVSSSIVRNLLKFHGKTEHLLPKEVQEIIEKIK
jgi:pantetheine-phosphate adenylyltransferase